MEEKYKSIICIKGHRSSVLHQMEESFDKYCKKCGAENIDSCLECNSIIKGGDFYFGIYSPEMPNYCYNCGKPYPWTQKKLKDFKEILELQEEEITSDLQIKIFETVKSLSAENDQDSSLGLQKLGLLIKKLPSKDIIINTLSGILSSAALELLKK